MSTEELGPRQRAAATKRRRTDLWILDTARAMFDEHGYHGVTRDDVIREAGIGSTTLQKRYKTKQALAIAAYAPSVLALMASPEPMPAIFIRELADFLVAHPVMAVALLPLSRDPRTQSEDDAATYVVSFRDLVEFIGKLLVQRADVRTQDSAMVNDTAAFALCGLLTWIVQHPGRSGEDAAKLMLAHLL
jgi:AcrR family transcriptional regulator